VALSCRAKVLVGLSFPPPFVPESSNLFLLARGATHLPHIGPNRTHIKILSIASRRLLPCDGLSCRARSPSRPLFCIDFVPTETVDVYELIWPRAWFFLPSPFPLLEGRVFLSLSLPSSHDFLDFFSFFLVPQWVRRKLIRLRLLRHGASFSIRPPSISLLSV